MVVSFGTKTHFAVLNPAKILDSFTSFHYIPLPTPGVISF